MRFSRLLVVTLVAGLTAACSSAPADSSPTILTSHQDLCAGSPPEYGDHVVTAVSCPFVQHTDNIAKYGESLSAPTDLLDGTGTKVATITNTCDTWALGTDAQGLTVVVRIDNGEVISHGTQHPGQALSRLPSVLALPVRLR